MKGKRKELREALERLENCCPSGLSDSVQQTLTSELREALFDLDRARHREQRLREESDALLEGMEIIISADSTGKAFTMVLEVLKRLLGFDDAFVLQEQSNGSLATVASSSPLFDNLVWQHSVMFKHVLSGNHVNMKMREISTSTDWQGQPPEVRQNVSSALHTPFNTTLGQAILVCTSIQEGFFNKARINLLKRFSPLAGQALYNLEINDLLREEILERKKGEDALREAHDNLELRVEQRTAELRDSNELLKDEINERRRAEEEKAVLLREVHHRVKNNYTIIISLLSLQSGNMKDEGIKAIFSESANRIKSMSLVHEQLYSSQNLSKIDFGSYIETLTKLILMSYEMPSSRVKIQIDIKDVELNIETSIPLGLVVNELVSNAMKHAFPGDREGEIIISMKKNESKNEYELMIEDNGVGLPEGFDIHKTDTLGLKLVTMMAENQLNGNIELMETLRSRETAAQCSR
jgi:two-component sensor histidine kinase